MNYLVVGGGISGCLIALKLKLAGESVSLFSVKLPGEASFVSSGLINPITGLRFVKSWNFEKLQEHFLKEYKFLETRYDAKFIHEHEILVDLSNALEMNNWYSRLNDPLYKDYCSILNQYHGEAFKIHNEHSFGIIHGAIRVDLCSIIEHIQNEFEREGLLHQDLFDYKLIQVDNGQCIYNHQHCKGIIFCEGSFVKSNPYFSEIPIVKLKGERLLFKKNLKEENIYHSIYSIIPMEKSFWVGSNYNLKDISYEKTEIEKNSQWKFAQGVFQTNLELEDHTFGIRAATRDRRPIVGIHPEFPALSIVNGLGTKGASLAPYCTQVLLNRLLAQEEIPSEVNLKRFVKL